MHPLCYDIGFCHFEEKFLDLHPSFAFFIQVSNMLSRINSIQDEKNVFQLSLLNHVI